MFVETTENWTSRIYLSKYLRSILMCQNCSKHSLFPFHWKDCLQWYPPILYRESIDYKLQKAMCTLHIHPQIPAILAFCPLSNLNSVLALGLSAYWSLCHKLFLSLSNNQLLFLIQIQLKCHLLDDQSFPFTLNYFISSIALIPIWNHLW